MSKISLRNFNKGREKCFGKKNIKSIKQMILGKLNFYLQNKSSFIYFTFYENKLKTDQRP